MYSPPLSWLMPNRPATAQMNRSFRTNRSFRAGKTGHQLRPWEGPRLCLLAALLLILLPACSVKRLAMNQVGDALAASGTTFASDNDPELIREAIPFTLKLVESVLAETPGHRQLRTAAAAYFTQYAYGFIQLEADYVEIDNFDQAEAMRTRAKHLFLRARDHGLLRLEREHPALRTALQTNPAKAAATLEDPDLVEPIYWTAAAWGLAIALSKDDPFLIAEIPQMEALIDQALRLNSTWNRGAIHSFLVTFEMIRQPNGQDREAQSRMHFEKAIAASQGHLLSPYVSLAEAVSIQNQDANEFQALLETALAINVDEYPPARLVNLLMRKRAQWLLSQREELFLLEDDIDWNE